MGPWKVSSKLAKTFILSFLSNLLLAHRPYSSIRAPSFLHLLVHDFSPAAGTPTDSDDEADTIVSATPLHTQLLPTGDKGTKQASCRAVIFSNDGSQIFTGGNGGDICMVDSETVCTFSSFQTSSKAIRGRLPEAHRPHGVHVLHQLPSQAPPGALLVSGDEEGAIRFWDQRMAADKNKAVISWNENEDYISGFDHDQEGNTLLASSADGTISIFDLRKGPRLKPNESAIRRSDVQDDEILSIKIIKNGRKVVCGTQDGVLAVWSWGTWGDISDRFPGHPASIDALLKVDEDTVLTGSSDGILRLVQIFPDKFLGVLGDHDGYPIEKLQFNADKSVVGSVSHDNFIRLWDASALQEDSEDDDEEEKVSRTEPAGGTSAVAAMPSSGPVDSEDEWDDEDDEKDSDDSGDDESVEPTKNDRLAKRFKSDNEKFFEDL